MGLSHVLNTIIMTLMLLTESLNNYMEHRCELKPNYLQYQLYSELSIVTRKIKDMEGCQRSTVVISVSFNSSYPIYFCLLTRNFHPVGLSQSWRDIAQKQPIDPATTHWPSTNHLHWYLIDSIFLILPQFPSNTTTHLSTSGNLQLTYQFSCLCDVAETAAPRRNPRSENGPTGWSTVPLLHVAIALQLSCYFFDGLK